MAGLTSSGLVIKTRSEIFDNFMAKLKARVDPMWDDRTNNLVNIISNIYAEEASDLWGGVQSAYDAAYPLSAFDVSLDNVADIVNVQRIPASQSFTQLQVTGLVGAVIPDDTVVTVVDTNERFLTQDNLTLSNTRFSDITFNITSVVDSTVYTVTIDSIAVSINSGVGATANSILTALKAAIDADVTGVTTSLPTSTTLRVNVTENNSVFSLVVGARIGVTSVSDLIQVVAQNFGPIKAPANTLTNLLVPIANVTSVTNLEAVKEGRLEETDSELRARRYESVSIIGAATEQAIIANVRNLDGVTAAFIIANRTFVTDVDGRPPKSFEVVVEGGDEEEIAQAIWLYHPVGIETTGDITRTIVDENGDSQSVKFSRPVTKYIRMEIDYTKYAEETFNTTGGEDGIAQAALSYGNTLNVGVDVIPQRFFGTIFNAVQGIESLVIRVSCSLDLMTWTPYQTTPIAIGKTERSNFDLTRITVTEV